MRTGLEVSQRALEMFNEREKYAYLYGAKGELGTEEFIRYMFKQYPAYFSKYSAEQLEQIVEYSKGKILYDCSGFVCHCAGIPTSYSGKLMSECTKHTTDTKEAQAGWLAWKTGHVGIDRGDGTFLHMYKELETVVADRFSNYDWQKQGRLRGVDYSYEDKIEDKVMTHTVQKGETLWKIAEKYYKDGKSYTKIMEINKLRNTTINVGQVLVIPQ